MSCEPDYILQTYRLFPTCHKLISECLKRFECLEGKEICESAKCGQETEKGFVVDKYVTTDQVHSKTSCFHWGVEVTADWSDRRYCTAKRHFKINLERELKAKSFCKPLPADFHALERDFFFKLQVFSCKDYTTLNK